MSSVGASYCLDGFYRRRPLALVVGSGPGRPVLSSPGDTAIAIVSVSLNVTGIRGSPLCQSRGSASLAAGPERFETIVYPAVA